MMHNLSSRSQNIGEVILEIKKKTSTYKYSTYIGLMAKLSIVEHTFTF